MSDFFYIGIDPGMTNTGWCLYDLVQNSCVTGVFTPRDFDTIPSAAASLINEVILPNLPEGAKVVAAGVERYVAYRGVFSKDTEQVLLFIGSLLFLLESIGIKVVLARSIDWKPFVCKELYKSNNFRNPSTSFDKKYSIAAAESILGKPLPKKTTNHAADAICLAYYSFHKK